MHDILQRQLKRAGFNGDGPPDDKDAWAAFLKEVSQQYEQSDQDRYLLERSLEVSSREMGEINQKLTEESNRVQERNQQFSRVYEFSRATLEQMRDSLLQSADRAELMVYVGDMLKELEIINKK